MIGRRVARRRRPDEAGREVPLSCREERMRRRARQLPHRAGIARDTLHRLKRFRPEGFEHRARPSISTPTAETVAAIAAQPIVDEVQERPRIPFAEERALLPHRRPDDVAFLLQLLGRLAGDAEVVEDVALHHLLAVAPYAV